MLRSLLTKDVFLRKKGFCRRFWIAQPCILVYFCFVGGEQKKRRLGTHLRFFQRCIFIFSCTLTCKSYRCNVISLNLTQFIHYFIQEENLKPAITRESRGD